MRKSKEWSAFCTDLAKHHADQVGLRKALFALAYLSIKERKELLKISRTARHPYYNPCARVLRIADRFYKSPESDFRCIEVSGLQVQEVVDILGQYIHKSPIRAAILNNACRSAPFLNTTAQKAKDHRSESWEKEIAACSGLPRGPQLDYTCWFSDNHEDRRLPLCDALPAAPMHNHRIHKAFKKWRSEMEHKRLFPQVSQTKSMSRVTAVKYRKHLDGSSPGIRGFSNNVTSSMIERMYSEMGIEISGPCEMRQTWGYNDLTPRTYFTQGGSTFHSSKYIRKPLNSLCDQFEEVNFVTRFNVQDLVIHDGDIAFIYDFESFTSNLEEFQYFLAALAEFGRGTQIQIVDSRHGIQNVDLGDLIEEYNQVCNINPEFCVYRYQEDDFTVYHHTKAGFLGVYGNIIGSTILHGLYATQIDGDNSQARCVGDDAFVRRFFHECMSKQPEVIERLKVLGIVHEEKTTTWGSPEGDLETDTNSTWPYCKRPMFRSGNRIVQEPNISLPILGRLCGFQDEVRCEEDVEPYEELVKIAAIQTRSAFRQIQLLVENQRVDLSSMNDLLSYLGFIYRRLGLPEEGLLPFESHRVDDKRRISGVLVPPLDLSLLNEDVWDLLQRRYESAPSLMLLPRVVHEGEDNLDELFRSGETQGTSSQEISYLRKMGWCETSLVKELCSMTFEQYRRFYDRIFDGDAIFVYDVKLSSLTPSWLTELCIR